MWRGARVTYKHNTILVLEHSMHPGGLEPAACGYMPYRKANNGGKKIHSALIKKTDLSQLNLIIEVRTAKFRSIHGVESTVCAELIKQSLAVRDSLSWSFIFPVYFLDLTGAGESWFPHYGSFTLKLILVVFFTSISLLSLLWSCSCMWGQCHLFCVLGHHREPAAQPKDELVSLGL